MKIGLYAAVAENGVIGNEGGMPWRLSTDMKRFKATTMGKPLIMGRKTWESFPRRPLPGRLNIVVTRNRDLAEEGAVVVHSLDEALRVAAKHLEESGSGDEIAVIGGGEIYRQAMELADRLHVTHIQAEIEGDTYFPAIDPQVWRAVHSEEVPPGESDTHSTRYVVYERIANPAN
jgi:dihydrofolate reductase